VGSLANPPRELAQVERLRHKVSVTQGNADAGSAIGLAIESTGYGAGNDDGRESGKQVTYHGYACHTPILRHSIAMSS